MGIAIKPLAWILLISSIFFSVLLILYLSNNLFPTLLSNPPDYGMFITKEYAQREQLAYWPKPFISLALILIAYLSLIFSLGYYRRSRGQNWHFVKKDLGTNILNFGLLALGIFFFLSLWPTNAIGTISWSLMVLFTSALISLFLFYHEPITEVTTPQQIEQIKKQKTWLAVAKTVSLAIATASFIFSLVFTIIFILFAEKEGLAGLALLLPMFIFAAGVPVPLVLYFYFRSSLQKQEHLVGQVVEPKSQQTNVASKPPSKLPMGTILFILLILALVIIMFLFFTASAPRTVE